MGLERNILIKNKFMNKNIWRTLWIIVYKLKNTMKNKMLKIIIKNDKIEIQYTCNKDCKIMA